MNKIIHVKIIFSVLNFSVMILSCSKNRKSDSFNDETYVFERPKLSSTTESEKQKKIDFDLTKMSATMIYAEIFNMMIDPDTYNNKIIKVKGFFQVFHDDYSNEDFYTIIIPDATACCQQGIEFIWEGEHTFPDDYPEQESEITITGKYISLETADGVSYSYMSVFNLE